MAKRGLEKIDADRAKLITQKPSRYDRKIRRRAYFLKENEAIESFIDMLREIRDALIREIPNMTIFDTQEALPVLDEISKELKRWGAARALTQTMLELGWY